MLDRQQKTNLREEILDAFDAFENSRDRQAHFKEGWWWQLANIAMEKSLAYVEAHNSSTIVATTSLRCTRCGLKADFEDTARMTKWLQFHEQDCPVNQSVADWQLAEMKRAKEAEIKIAHDRIREARLEREEGGRW